MTWGSSIQASSRSLPETSALLPSEMNAWTPSPSSRATSSRAIPTPPDCEATARPPGGGTVSENVALRRMAGSLVITPRQFGPTRRMLFSRATRTISRCMAAPSGPSSASPDEMTTTAETPASAASWTAARTRAAGTATIARSTCAGTRVSRGKAGIPSIEETSGWTTDTAPSNLPSTIDVRTACPSPAESRRTPTTATLLGYSRGARDLASETLSRASAASMARAEAAVLISTNTTPDALRRDTSNPASWKTRIMAPFSGSTSATNRRTPWSRPAAARCSRSRLPRPWPCSPSATRNATSAASASVRSAVATATIRPCVVATSVATLPSVPWISRST